LRFLGATDFAKGDWAGIELSEKLGKNDGSVLGKRYFTCEPLYGLFAPANKISAYNGATTTTTAPPPSTPTNLRSMQKTPTASSASKLSGATPFVTKTGLVSANPAAGGSSQSNLTQSVSGSRLKLNKQHSGSQESLVSEKSSIYSTASGVATASSRKSLAASQQQQLLLQKSASKMV
jgi:hypothetical protein